MKPFRCSICEQYFDPEQSRSMPFCSDRCRQIDLGRWLKEENGMPYEGPPGEDVQQDREPTDK
jgi:hypothetical protein